ncbi:MAG: peptidyl-prolyl cis-trans isomerase [Betaproteobacteria bacterium]|nr:peptidyl-prolyl cis-trans isomerase [Betaproteobacteria bacterium]
MMSVETIAQSAASKSPSLRVNGMPIEAALVEQGVKRALEAGLPNNAATREMVESELIAREALRQEARRQGLDRHPDVEQARRDAGDAAMVQMLIARELRQAAVTEDEVRQRYQQIVASLGAMEYKARSIVLSDQATAQRIIAMAQSEPKQFEALAKQHSQDARAQQGGEMEWISFPVPVQQGKTQHLPFALADAVSKLQPGLVAAAPVFANGAWHVLKLDAIRPTVIPAYDQAKAGIRTLLERQRTEQAAATLVTKIVGAARIDRVAEK